MIADFGLAQDAEIMTHWYGVKDLDELGSLPYMAPELFKHAKSKEDDWRESMRFQQKVDMWALGCTFYYAMSLASPFGKKMFDGKAKVVEAIIEGTFEPLDEFYRDDINQLIYKLM